MKQHQLLYILLMRAGTFVEQWPGFTLKSYSIQKQPYSLSLITRKKFREASLRQNILKFYIQNPQKLFLRLRSLFIDGFTNKYLLCVFEKI